MTNIYQIKITLKGSKPSIWRRLLISSDTELIDLHKIIQTAMGWTNSHLHQFVINKEYYGPNEEDEDGFNESDAIDYTGIKVSEVLKKEKSKIEYEYDFGDSWDHTVELEKILPPDASKLLPVCTAGKMNCPPEDCGGVWGYASMLEILKQPSHPEYEGYIEWLGGEFDPEDFDIDFINEQLQDENYGCLDLGDMF